jgi:drug/metabolite transporter (DMT)-like permease
VLAAIVQATYARRVPMRAPEPPHPPLSPSLLAALVTLLCLIWGSTWWAIRLCLHDQPPLWSAALRFLVAGLALAALVPALRRVDRAPAPPRWLWLAAGATNFAGSYGVLYIAEQHVPSGLAAVLWSVFPLLMALSSVLVLGETLRSVQWLGFAVSFVGIVVVFAGTGDDGAAPLGACLLLLLSPLVSAIGTTLIKKFGHGSSSLQLNRNGMLTGAVLLLLAAALREPWSAMRWSMSGTLALVYLALIGTALTFGVYFWLLQRVPASRLALISYVTPVLAVVLGVVVGDGDSTVSLWLGTALVTAGVALVVRRPTA